MSFDAYNDVLRALLLASLVGCGGKASLDVGDQGDGRDGGAASDDGGSSGSDDAPDDRTGDPRDSSGIDEDERDRDGGADAAAADSGTAPDGGSGHFVPAFPGAPQSETGKPLTGGAVCDDVPGATIETISDVTRCFYGPDDDMTPAATIEQVLECVDGAQTVRLRLTFNPGFNDNTYGEGSIGWPPVRGHWFRDLTGSDHAELKLIDGNGEVAMQFKLDYLERDDSAPSGYATQCASGGDGNVSVGDAAHILDCATSLDRNLNERGYGDYVVDSPITNASYSVNAEAPEWDYRMVFEVWVDVAAFGDAGFAGAFIEYVHASPSKDDQETIEVESDECPCVTGPDIYCEPPPPYEEEPPYCELYPTDPACVLI